MPNSRFLASTERSHPEIPADLRRYVDEAGRVVVWPGKRKVVLLVLEYLAALFESGRFYSEKEVNQVLSWYLICLDYATVRRDLCDLRYLGRERDGSRYWRLVRDEKPREDGR